MAIEQGKTIEFHDIDTVYGAIFSGLPYRGFMGEGEHPSKDFNDYRVNGIYSNGGTNSGFINAPHSADNGYLAVVGGGLNQFWFSEFQLLPAMYRHLTSKANNTWSDWSSLVLNVDALSYEEIMATNPVPDLTNKIASANVLKTLSDNLSGFSVLKASTVYGNWDIDDLSSYPLGIGILHFTDFIQPNATGTLPFPDGHLLTFIWRNEAESNSVLTQLAIEDEGTAVIKIRSYDKSAKAWQAWKNVSFHN